MVSGCMLYVCFVFPPRFIATLPIALIYIIYLEKKTQNFKILKGWNDLEQRRGLLLLLLMLPCPGSSFFIAAALQKSTVRTIVIQPSACEISKIQTQTSITSVTTKIFFSEIKQDLAGNGFLGFLRWQKVFFVLHVCQTSSHQMPRNAESQLLWVLRHLLARLDSWITNTPPH